MMQCEMDFKKRFLADFCQDINQSVKYVAPCGRQVQKIVLQLVIMKSL